MRRTSILQLLAGSGGDGLGDGAGAQGGDLVGELGGGEGALGGGDDGAAEADVLGNGVASLLGVGEEDGGLAGRVDQGGAADENLGAHAGVDGVQADVVPESVDDIDGGGEADKGLPAVDVLEVVVGVGDVALALVLGAVAVRVADQGALPVVVEVGVRDGDEVGAVGDVEETVQVVLAGGEVAGELAVVNPDVGDLVEGDGVAVLGEDLVDLEVADDDVVDAADLQTDTGDGCGEIGVS